MADYYKNDYEEDYNQNSQEQSYWPTIIGFVISMVVVFAIFGNNKYEGMTAEDWFNAYDQENARYIKLYDCVDDLTYNEYYEDIRYDCL